MKWLAFAVLVEIPGGTAHLGVPDRLEPPQMDEPRRSVTIPAFAIDRNEVTRADYAVCVIAGACAPNESFGPLDLLSQAPVTGVSWRDAFVFCRAQGERLPTEAEWERAARGADGARIFPWGDTPDCARANWGSYDGEGRCPAHPGHPVPVGSYPSGASPEGVLDLAGNVWEWTADFYEVRRRSVAIARGAEELGTAPRRSVRGGGCCSVLAYPRAGNRVGYPEDYRDVDLGFRCAKSVTSPSSSPTRTKRER